MGDLQSPQHPLEVLPAMLNLVVNHHDSLFDSEYSHAAATGDVQDPPRP